MKSFEVVVRSNIQCWLLVALVNKVLNLVPLSRDNQHAANWVSDILIFFNCHKGFLLFCSVYFFHHCQAAPPPCDQGPAHEWQFQSKPLKGLIQSNRSNSLLPSSSLLHYLRLFIRGRQPGCLGSRTVCLACVTGGKRTCATYLCI